jgi:hypothetical protein
MSDNSYNGVSLMGSRNNNIESNFIMDNNIGIYVEYNRYKKYVIELEFVDSESNQFSNNNFNGNSQDIRRVDNVLPNYFEPIITLILTLLSIATTIIAISSIAVVIARKQRHFQEDERQERSPHGISAIIIESVGAIIFIICALFVITIDTFLIGLFILVPFAIVGIIVSRDGLRRDSRKGLARLGLGFGIPLLILGALLIVIVIVIGIIIVAVIYAFIASGGW